MKMIRFARPFLCFAFGLASSSAVFGQTGYTGIFGGGPFYINATNNINEIKNSGFTEVIVWNIEVKPNGDLNFNGEFPLVSNGVYIGGQTHPDFAGNMAVLKQGTVKRVTFSIGSSNVGDWQDVTALVNAQGTGTDSILYKNFAALKAAIPALDALDFDDENSYDTPTTVAFGVMLGGLGYRVNPDPFTNNSYWINVVAQINAQLPGTVDGVHLQAYAGGAGNNPCVGWNFGSVPVWPGLWDLNDSPSQVQTIMSGWNNQCGINGGFMWLYDDFVGNGLAAQYAAAINAAVASEESFTISGPSARIDYPGFHRSSLDHHHSLERFRRRGDPKSVASPAGGESAHPGSGNVSTEVTLPGHFYRDHGSRPVTITGTSGSLTETFNFTLTVNPSTN